MYLGEYQHTLDSKGRVFIPAKLRESLGGEFYICKGFDGCLFAYDAEEWEKFSSKLIALSNASKKGRMLKRSFFAGASESKCDKQGRVLLPAGLRAYAGMKKNVTIIGSGNKVEIWDTERWQEQLADNDEFLTADLEDLDIDL